MFDSLEIIKETSHKDASLKLNELITQFIEKNKNLIWDYQVVIHQNSFIKLLLN